MEENQNPMALDADGHVTRLESGLSHVREQARVQQNTLDDILQLLQRVPALRNSQRPRDMTIAPEVPILTMPTSDSTPHVWVRGLKPATPNDFDGDCLKGWAFLNLCQLYISL